MPKTYKILVKALPEAVVKQLLREGKEHGLTQQQLILRKLEMPYRMVEALSATRAPCIKP